MTPEALAAIKVRAEAVNRPDRAPPLFYDTQFGHPAYALADDRDTEFWAHARTDVPALVAEAERLRQALEDYGAHSEGCSGQYGPSYRCRCGWRDEARALGIGVHEEGAS